MEMNENDQCSKAFAPETPPHKSKKMRHGSPSKDCDSVNWTAAAVRVLQKDVSNMMSVSSSLIERIGQLEKQVGSCDFLKLPCFQPAVHVEPRGIKDYIEERVVHVESYVDKVLFGVGSLSDKIDGVTKRTADFSLDISTICGHLKILDHRLSSLEPRMQPAVTEDSELGELSSCSSQMAPRIECLEKELARAFDAIDSIDRGLFAITETGTLKYKIDESVSEYLQSHNDLFSAAVGSCADSDAVEERAERLEDIEQNVTVLFRQVRQLKEQTQGTEPPPWAKAFFDMLSDNRDFAADSICKIMKRLNALELKA